MSRLLGRTHAAILVAPVVVFLAVLWTTEKIDAQQAAAEEAQALTRQIQQLYAQGRYAQAIPLATRVLEIHEQLLGPDHIDTATALNNLAQLHYAAGAHAKAEPLFRRSLAIRERELSPQHRDLATSLNNLANVYMSMGIYARAEPLLQRAVAIDEKAHGVDHPDTAPALTSLASLYLLMADHRRAELLYQRVVRIREKALGPNHPNTALALNNLAQLLEQTGDYARAEALLRAALDINVKTLGLEHPNTAIGLNNLGQLYTLTGDYARAEPLLQQAIAIDEKVLGPAHPNTARALNSLALLYDEMREYKQAEPVYQRALAIAEEVFGREHPETATALGNLASLYRSTNQYAKAEPLAQQVLAVTEKVQGPDHPDTGACLIGLAGIYYSTGAYARAEPLVQRGLGIYQKALGPDHPRTAMALENLGSVRAAAGQATAALQALEEAQAIGEKNHQRFLLSGSEARKQAYMQRAIVSAFGDVTFSLSAGSAQAIALGASRVLQYKGRVLDAMTDSVARLRRAVSPADRSLFEEAADIARQLSTATFQGPGNQQPDEYLRRLGELARRQDELEMELSKRSAEFGRQVRPITLENVRQATPDGAVLLEWFRYVPIERRLKGKPGPARYVVYVISRGSETAAIDIGEAPPIDRLVHEFRQSLSNPNRTDVKEIAGELSEKLVKPLKAHLDRVERVLVSPDGALNLLPFGALLDDRQQYLTLRIEIAYLTSGRDLLRYASKPNPPGAPVVVADPEYGPRVNPPAAGQATLQLTRSADLDRAGMVFEPLAGTKAEALALKILLGVNDEGLLMGAGATEARLKRVQGPRVLHVATHGFFLTDNQLAAEMLPSTFEPDVRTRAMSETPLLRSGLALAGANARKSGTADDGILTAAEVAQLDLTGTQLVVLSACDTGLGEVQNGEGVYGLRRSLVLAGAQTQVTSLWKVADAATKDLMVEYYERLLKGEGRAAALRASQRTMIESQDRSHPYYWAAFIPIGNWTALPANAGAAR